MNLLMHFKKEKTYDKLIVKITNENNEIIKEIIFKNVIIDNDVFLRKNDLISYIKTLNTRSHIVSYKESNCYYLDYKTSYGQSIKLKIYYQEIMKNKLNKKGTVK